jgi:peptidoglycan/LPS O-acetylase OafA/YrhL
VSLFFVISGFILGLPFVTQHALGGKRVSLRAYFLRRLTRLEPPYVISLLAAALLALVIRRDALADVLGNLGVHLVYLHEILRGDGGLSTVTWSLEIEVQFYLLVPLLALVFKLPTRPRRVVLVSGILAFGALGWYLGSLGWPRTILQNLQFFLSGFLLADLHVHAPPPEAGDAPAPGHAVRDLAGLALLLALPFAVLNPWTAAFCAPLMMAGFYSCTLNGHRLRRLFSSLVLSRIGGACYSMYLLHFLVIAATGRFALGFLPDSYTAGFVLLALACMPPILISTAIFYRAVELPCMDRDWPGRLWAFLRRTPSA